jgi:hypothetical protein
MGACCTTVNNHDEHNLLMDYCIVNTLPTYENICEAYTDLNLPELEDRLLSHKKE